MKTWSEILGIAEPTAGQTNLEYCTPMFEPMTLFKDHLEYKQAVEDSIFASWISTDFLNALDVTDFTFATAKN